jgi:hypothetical protein
MLFPNKHPYLFKKINLKHKFIIGHPYKNNPTQL